MINSLLCYERDANTYRNLITASSQLIFLEMIESTSSSLGKNSNKCLQFYSLYNLFILIGCWVFIVFVVKKSRL